MVPGHPSTTPTNRSALSGPDATPTTPPTNATAARRGVERARKSIKRPMMTSPANNASFDDDLNDLFVVEPTKRQRKLHLTEHQREKLAEKR
jgi:hypothetical protein